MQAPRSPPMSVQATSDPQFGRATRHVQNNSWHPDGVQRVLVLGRGGAGKSTFARRLGEALDLPVVELDSHFWQADLSPLSAREWTETQARLTSAARWVMDGDLGPYDVLRPRLEVADTVFVLDFPLWRCAWRSLIRGQARGDYWRWVITYRRIYLPHIMQQIAAVPEKVALRILRRPSEVDAASRRS